MMQTRRISFAGSTLSIEFSGSQPAKVIDLLYRHIPAGADQPGFATYRLLNDPQTDLLRLYRDKALLYQGDCAATAAELLLGDTCYHLAAQSQAGLLFHAAALSWQGRGLILPGASGSGKSTLTAWLLSQGFDYLTDELVFVPWQTDSIQAFTRPINLKSPARFILSNIFDFEKQAAGMLSSSYATLIPPALFYPAQTGSEAPLALIIFPRYQVDSSFELQPLSKAQAGLTLMQTLINARNLPEHGFAEITRLVRQTPAYTMRYSSFDEISQEVRKLLETQK
ncbi:MAG: hypothetical protein HC875_37030 [Anaerolineales bacterium]|nr:hypothetical protein [Anaerolineales bacterium]